jgi:putative redox protein
VEPYAPVYASATKGERRCTRAARRCAVATRSVEVRWTGEGLRCEGITEHGSIDISGGGADADFGPTPMLLLLLAAGACTAMDVVDVLRKMRQPLEALSVEVVGEKAEEFPQEYKSIEIVYHVKGDVSEAKLQRAIELSETRYCSVEATLRAGVPIGSRYVMET